VIVLGPFAAAVVIFVIGLGLTRLIGIPEFIIVAALAAPLIGVMLFVVALGRRAKRFGYASTRAYLRAVPRSDAETRDAADLALKGLVCCALGLLFSPFVLVGLVPLFYGGRKLVYVSMGLGLVDDADRPEA
jgi:hypothetical protein